MPSFVLSLIAAADSVFPEVMEDQTVEEQRIEDLWFDDGDIRIAVGDQVCCVHRSALAEASPVLRDMFDFPQPPGDDPSRPPLFTFPDRPDQVLHWLKAMLLPGCAFDEKLSQVIG